MTDKELLLHQLKNPPVMSMALNKDHLYQMMAERMQEAADRIEQLVATNEALTNERDAAEQRGYANAMEAERKLHEDRIEALEAKLAENEVRLRKAVEALEQIASITVHSGGEIHGVTAQHWQTAFEVAQDEAIITLAELTGGKDAEG